MVHAVTVTAAWMPAFIVLGLILVIIPRPRLWIFRVTMLGAGALGYCQRLLPFFPRSSAASVITERTAALTSHLALRLPSSAAKASALVWPPPRSGTWPTDTPMASPCEAPASSRGGR